MLSNNIMMRIVGVIICIRAIWTCDTSQTETSLVITKNGSISIFDFRNVRNVTKFCIKRSVISRLNLNTLCQNALDLRTIVVDEYTILPKHSLINEKCGQVKIIELLSSSFYLEHDTFVGFKGLEKLTFSYGNSPLLLTKSILHGLDNLLSLTITHTNFFRITTTAFQHLNELLYLNLRFNKLEIIDANAFKNLKKLEFIDLSFNFLKEIYYDKFNGLENLKSFYFFGSGNFPNDIQEFLIFIPMRNLQHICIDNYTWTVEEKLKWYGELMEHFHNLTTICYISVNTYFPEGKL